MTALPARRIDLRSDTVTRPTPAMREAMFTAELGDDVLGDDPTVQRLEAMAAERLGKEAALFVPSGTMANLVAVLTHCRHGDEAIVGSRAHILQVEVGGAAGLAGVQLRTAANDEHGRVNLDEMRGLFRANDPTGPRTALVCLENTHNFCNGSPLSADYTAEVAGVAHAHGAALHIDGARVFNAAIALETTAAALARDADSVSFCLSKGLSCPVGSLVCGSAGFAARARRMRRMLGGGMRQSGVLAAAGIVALDEMVDRLAEDHVKARRLAAGMASIAGIEIDPSLVHTNILFFSVGKLDAQKFWQGMKQRGVDFLYQGSPRLRLVTHKDIQSEDVDYVLESMEQVIKSLS